MWIDTIGSFSHSVGVFPPAKGASEVGFFLLTVDGESGKESVLLRGDGVWFELVVCVSDR